MCGVICRVSKVEFGFAACFRMEEVMRVWRVIFVREDGARGGRLA